MLSNAKLLNFPSIGKDFVERWMGKATPVVTGASLTRSYDLSPKLLGPLAPGRYLYFMTFKSKLRANTGPESKMWNVALASNQIEFEVLPNTSGGFQLLVVAHQGTLDRL